MNGITRIEMDALNAVRNIERKMKDQREIDWEQRRYEVASTALNALISNPVSFNSDVTYFSQFEEMTIEEKVKAVIERNAEEAVMIADALIAELKKGGEK